MAMVSVAKRGPAPVGIDERRWKKMFVNARRAERLTGWAPITEDGWEIVAVLLMDMLEKKGKAKRRRVV